MDRLHQHDVGVELPRLVNSSLTMVLGPSGQGSWQGAQAIRETVCVFAGALWAGSTNKNVGVEPPRRVQHEFVGVRAVGIAAIREMHGR